jgi:hypothetical protein
MKAQLLLVEGPYDMNLISYASHHGEFPLELRVGSADEAAAMDEKEFHAAAYRRRSIEDMSASLMKFGAYDFVGMKPTRHSLVDVWVT